MARLTRSDRQATNDYFRRLLEQGRGDRAAWPVTLDPEQLGLRVVGGEVQVPAGLDLLDAGSIRERLSVGTSQWLRHLEVFAAIDSTNSVMMERAAEIGGTVLLAECQTDGRGRRGRTWFSPFASNIAVTMGFECARKPAALSGLSLVIGLAIVDALSPLGEAAWGLKWPNDVQVGGRKIAGILVELQSLGTRTFAVVGVGINVALPAAVSEAVDQEITDLRQAGVTADRNRIAAGVLNSVHDFFVQFDGSGFGPLRDAWNRYHVLDGQEVDVIGPADSRLSGRVVGVDVDGALQLDVAGRVQPVVAGEVSVRRRSA